MAPKRLSKHGERIGDPTSRALDEQIEEVLAPLSACGWYTANRGVKGLVVCAVYHKEYVRVFNKMIDYLEDSDIESSGFSVDESKLQRKVAVELRKVILDGRPARLYVENIQRKFWAVDFTSACE
jgi:hypothetical protein